MEKYGHLMSNYRPLRTRREVFLGYGVSGPSGTVAAFEKEYNFSSFGTEGFERHLKRRLARGQHIVYGWDGEVMEKYGHLMAHYRRPQDFEPETGFQALENLLSKEESESNASRGADENS